MKTQKEFLIIDCTASGDNMIAALSYLAKEQKAKILGIIAAKENLFDKVIKKINKSSDQVTPLPTPTPAESAVDTLLHQLEKNADKSITILALGPLTTLAKAYQRNATLFRKAKSIVSLGGGVLCGDITPCAEANYWKDPHAASIVFQSSVPIFMVGINVTNGMATPSLLAAMAVFHPKIFQWVHCNIQVAEEGITKGETVADIVDAWKWEKNAYAAMNVQKKVKKMLPDISN